MAKSSENPIDIFLHICKECGVEITGDMRENCRRLRDYCEGEKGGEVLLREYEELCRGHGLELHICRESQFNDLCLKVETTPGSPCKGSAVLRDKFVWTEKRGLVRKLFRKLFPW